MNWFMHKSPAKTNQTFFFISPWRALIAKERLLDSPSSASTSERHVVSNPQWRNTWRSQGCTVPTNLSRPNSGLLNPVSTVDEVEKRWRERRWSSGTRFISRENVKEKNRRGNTRNTINYAFQPFSNFPSIVRLFSWIK